MKFIEFSEGFLDEKVMKSLEKASQVAFAPAELQELQGRDFEDGADFAARCQRRLTATVGPSRRE